MTILHARIFAKRKFSKVDEPAEGLSFIPRANSRLILSLDSRHHSSRKPHDRISQSSVFSAREIGRRQAKLLKRHSALNGFYWIFYWLTDRPLVVTARLLYPQSSPTFIYQKSCAPLNIHMLGESARLLDGCWRIFAVYSTHICRSISAFDVTERAKRTCRLLLSPPWPLHFTASPCISYGIYVWPS